MTLTATWGRRLGIALAVLVLAPALALLTGPAQAEAASWKTVGSSWATGVYPAVLVGGSTKADPDALRIQVTNHATKAREIYVTWERICIGSNGKITEKSGEYSPQVGKGKTHTKKLSLPKNAIECYVIAAAMVDSPVKGKVTLKVQSAH